MACQHEPKDKYKMQGPRKRARHRLLVIPEPQSPSLRIPGPPSRRHSRTPRKRVSPRRSAKNACGYAPPNGTICIRLSPFAKISILGQARCAELVPRNPAIRGSGTLDAPFRSTLPPAQGIPSVLGNEFIMCGPIRKIVQRTF